jgi:hypothetical protein
VIEKVGPEVGFSFRRNANRTANINDTSNNILSISQRDRRTVKEHSDEHGHQYIQGNKRRGYTFCGAIATISCSIDSPITKCLLSG